MTGKAVAEPISKGVHDLGLDMSLCRYTNIISKDTSDYTSFFYFRGQCYDGAGNMSGPVKCAAAIIKKSYLMAKYVHCSSHQLNLCIKKACSGVWMSKMYF